MIHIYVYTGVKNLSIYIVNMFKQYVSHDYKMQLLHIKSTSTAYVNDETYSSRLKTNFGRGELFLQQTKKFGA